MVALHLPLAGLVQIVREAPGVYRPRHPERTPFYRLLEECFEEFALIHEERFERKDGPLRAVVRKAVEAFLACGRPENGFARMRCPDSRAEYLAPFSCQTRNFCPSCQQKRALLFAEKLREEILSKGRIRHRDTDGEIRISGDWLPDGEIGIGLTASASAPNLEIGRVVARILECREGEE